MSDENLEKIYVIKTKSVSSFVMTQSRKNAGGKNEGKFHYVAENKCSKNVRNEALHYIDENKASYRQLSIMFMKIKGVIQTRGREK